MNLKEISANQLLDLKNILKNIPKADYVKSLSILEGFSIGKHTRHILEFYEIFLFNIKNGKVCYDDRKRNTLIEEDSDYAREFINKLLEQLCLVDNINPIKLIAKFDSAEISIDSSWERELIFNIEHTNHHLTIIRIGLKTCFPEIDIPSHLGFSNATLLYLKSQKG